MTVGDQGILITTGERENFCVPEAYNLLNEVHSLYVLYNNNFFFFCGYI